MTPLTPVWSNFEIGDLNFYRTQAYLDYFEHLDKAGGFYYERWGDAPVHSIAAALFANKSQIHWFQDIGYRHEPFQVSQACFVADVSTAPKATPMIEGIVGVISTTTLILNGEQQQRPR